MPGELDSKVALVTGGGAGIGEACALRLARGGAKVAVVDRDLQAAERVVTAIGESSSVAVQADVSNSADAEEMVAATVRRFGALHVAVNNAGVAGAELPTAEQSDADWRSVMAVNLDGVFYCTRAEIRSMQSSGGGSIVNMASVMGAVAFEGLVGYTTAKHGVVGLTQAAALDHAEDGIRVNAVAPGFIGTALLKGNMGADEQEAVAAFLAALHPMHRLGEPSEVAELVTWLASDASSFVTGAYYPVDGGYLAR
jgi:NAD(P)-dependent dehydrogenase (short-subunit alcohol dehydrogenase family)